jgi:hypothetical protein
MRKKTKQFMEADKISNRHFYVRRFLPAFKYHHRNLGKEVPFRRIENGEEIIAYKKYSMLEKKRIIEEYYETHTSRKKEIFQKYHITAPRFKEWKKEFIIIRKKYKATVIPLTDKNYIEDREQYEEKR